MSKSPEPEAPAVEAEPTSKLPHGARSRRSRVVRILMTLLALGFVGVTLWDLLRHWDGQMPRLRWALVAASAVPLAIGVLLQAFAWRVLLERMSGQPVPLRPAVLLHLDSMLARYTPGKVGLPIVRMAGAEAVGVRAATIAVSIGIEMLSFTAVGGLVGFALLAAASSSAGTDRLEAVGTWSWPFMLGFAALTVLLLTLDRRRLPRRALAALSLGGKGPLIPLALPLYHVVYWATWALHGHLITLAVGGSAAVAFASSGLYALAVVIGFLAMVAPAGAGVREAVISLGLAPSVGAPGTLAALLASRTVTVVAEVVVWAVARLALRSRPKT